MSSAVSFALGDIVGGETAEGGTGGGGISATTLLDSFLVSLPLSEERLLCDFFFGET